MRPVQKLAVLLLAATAVSLAAPAAVRADDKLVIDPEMKAKRGLYPIAIPVGVSSDPASAKLVADVLTFDLGVSSWFKTLDPRSFLADLDKEGMGIEPQRWKDVGAFGVVKSRAVVSGGKVTLQFKLYEVDRGAKPVLEREYSGDLKETRLLTHRWGNEVVKYYTGEAGFFGSQITFSGRSKKGTKVWVMDFDGANVSSVSKNDSINILPALSRSGTRIAFTSFMRGGADLYVTNLSGARPVRIARYSGMNTGAAWSPDGSKIALTLSKDGNPEIYVIDSTDGKIIKRLTNNREIDTSPTWSPDGKEIAFVSSREGSPQIFVMGADGSNPKRVSLEGTFNQTPAFSPKKGSRMLAWAARDDGGATDIVTMDLATGKMTRITQGQGSNEEPTWSPNGRVLAFTSNRKSGPGIYLANSDGTGDQRLVYKGSASSPDWGPAP